LDWKKRGIRLPKRGWLIRIHKNRLSRDKSVHILGREGKILKEKQVFSAEIGAKVYRRGDM